MQRGQKAAAGGLQHNSNSSLIGARHAPRPHLRHASAAVQGAGLMYVWLVGQAIDGGGVGHLAHRHRLARQHVFIHNRLAPAGSARGQRRAGRLQECGASVRGRAAWAPRCRPPPACAPDQRDVAGQAAWVQHHHIARQQLSGVDRRDAPVLQHLHLAGVVRQGGQAAAVLVRRHHVCEDGEQGHCHNDQAVAVVRLHAPARCGSRAAGGRACGAAAPSTGWQRAPGRPSRAHQMVTEAYWKMKKGWIISSPIRPSGLFTGMTSSLAPYSTRRSLRSKSSISWPAGGGDGGRCTGTRLERQRREGQPQGWHPPHKKDAAVTAGDGRAAQPHPAAPTLHPHP